MALRYDTISFLSDYGLVDEFVGVVHSVVRSIAPEVGITERAVQRIVGDLVESGYVTRERVGRRSRYTLNPEAKMRHAAQGDHEVGELLDLLELEPHESE